MAIAIKPSYDIVLPSPHSHQAEFIECSAKRVIVRAGRRSGKTVGAATRNVRRFLAGRRQLYTTPTSEQLGKWWFEVSKALHEVVKAGIFKKNETEHYIERPGTEQRMRGKTAWNADTMRGDYADDLTFDEWQLTDEDAWLVVGAPMLLDNNGDALFIYTPPSLRSTGVSKAHDPRHAAKMFRAAQTDKSGRWAAFHFTSHDNPFIASEALSELVQDMSKQSYRQEILAEDDELQANWLVYRAWNEALYRVPRFEIPESWPIYSGHDFGAANPAALFFAQVRLPLPPGAPAYMRWNDLVAWKEYRPSGMSIPLHVQNFKDIVGRRKLEKSLGGSPQEGEIRQGYTAHGWPIEAPKLRAVNAQVDKVIGLMELNKVFVFTDLLNYFEELANCLWSPDQEGKPTDKIKDEQRYHLCACARYILSDFTPETQVNRSQTRRASWSW